MRNMFLRLTAISPKKRFYQLANFCVVAVAGRKLPVIHVVEHPKCGGSWIRNMMQSYLGGTEYLVDGFVSRNMVIQVHRLYNRIYCNPIVVFRDPRDVYVSFYYHEKRYIQEGAQLAISRYYKHEPRRSLQDDFAEYLRCKLTQRTDPNFQYSEFVASWLDRANVCVVRYEDFLVDAEKELGKVFTYLGEPVRNNRIKEVVSYHSFKNETKRRYGEERQSGEEDKYKFQRKGIAGDWKNHFNKESCELIQKYEWDSLKRLGYEEDPSWPNKYLQQSNKI